MLSRSSAVHFFTDIFSFLVSRYLSRFVGSSLIWRQIFLVFLEEMDKHKSYPLFRTEFSCSVTIENSMADYNAFILTMLFYFYFSKQIDTHLLSDIWNSGFSLLFIGRLHKHVFVIICSGRPLPTQNSYLPVAHLNCGTS